MKAYLLKAQADALDPLMAQGCSFIGTLPPRAGENWPTLRVQGVRSVLLIRPSGSVEEEAK